VSKARSPQEIAEACGLRMHELDRMARSLGIALEEIAPGRSRVSMTVREDMANSIGTCHGGILFSLADCAFAYACNSRNRKTVAAGASIDYISAARTGDRLTAVCEERALVGRTGLYDIRVVDQSQELIACFRGRSRAVAGAILPELEEPLGSGERAAPEGTQQSRKR
jgi:acyl-CoA thioesterase